MEEKNYGKVLTIILIVIVVIIVGLLGFYGYDTFRKKTDKKQAEKAVEEFYDSIGDSGSGSGGTGNGNNTLPLLNETLVETTSSTGKKKTMYKGYNVVGTIEIPKINLKYPILERVTTESIKNSVAVMQPSAGPNKVGNTTIVGHNYRNGSFFGNNDRLSNGDLIYITDESGTRIKYIVYNIYTTDPSDADFMIRDTNGKREISLSTCTDNSKERLIIWAAEE